MKVHKKKLRDILSKLEKEGYRASRKKTEFFKKESTWLGYKITQNGEKPLYEKTEAIRKLKAPNNKKRLKSFLRSIQQLLKFINNPSKKTDRMNELLKKDTMWD